MKIFFVSPYPEGPGGDGKLSKSQLQTQSYASPGTQIDFGAPDDFSGGQVSVKLHNATLLTGLHHAMSMTALLTKIKWAEQQGYDAVIQSNTFDPGVEAARLAVSIPVVGVMRTSLHVATMLSDQIALTVPFEGHVAYTWKILRTYGMERFVKDIRPIGLYPGNMESEKQLYDRLVEVMQGIVRDVKPEYIIPLGGALVPNVVDPMDLEKEVGVPVMNTKIVSIQIAEMLVRTGMKQSPIAYPDAGLSYQDFLDPAHK